MMLHKMERLLGCADEMMQVEHRQSTSGQTCVHSRDLQIGVIDKHPMNTSRLPYIGRQPRLDEKHTARRQMPRHIVGGLLQILDRCHVSDRTE